MVKVDCIEDGKCRYCECAEDTPHKYYCRVFNAMALALPPVEPPKFSSEPACQCPALFGAGAQIIHLSGCKWLAWKQTKKKTPVIAGTKQVLAPPSAQSAEPWNQCASTHDDNTNYYQIVHDYMKQLGLAESISSMIICKTCKVVWCGGMGHLPHPKRPPGNIHRPCGMVFKDIKGSAFSLICGQVFASPVVQACSHNWKSFRYPGNKLYSVGKVCWYCNITRCSGSNPCSRGAPNQFCGISMNVNPSNGPMTICGRTVDPTLIWIDP